MTAHFTAAHFTPALTAVLWIVVLIGTIGLPISVARALRRRGVLFGTVWLASWSAWIVVSGVLAYAGVYAQRTDAVVVSLPIAFLTAFAAAYAFVGPADLAGLTRGHAFRVAGVGFLLAWAAGQLPAVFALPAGFGDIAVGLAAPAVAARLAVAGSGSGSSDSDSDSGSTRARALWFHALGLLDLVVALGLGVAAALGPVRILSVEPSTADAMLLPIVLIPTTAVPLLAAMHVRALLRLRHAPAPRPVLA
ncbi:hypothetical protein [Hamadaea tsunoensis]|uniref:hypothetical protein n=1 Tax=Hamadaea tsunoensis TaxID=53368 RepID=UPI00040D5324|nr:hypothetical protein [Hamadaea tsunoensis]